MTLGTLRRRIARAEYDAARMPLTLIERKVMARMSDDAPLRLGFERLLGSLDGAAGRLISDDQLTRRGKALSRRADYLEQATTLDAKASDRAQAGDCRFTERRKAADRQREQAEDARREQEDAAERRERQRCTKAHDEAEARKEKTKAEAKEAADRKRRDATDALAAKDQQISDRETRKTAEPRARRNAADDKQQDADQERSDAARLSELADVEREDRQGRS